MKLHSSAQTGQDTFAYEVTGRRKDGTFLDVGAYNLCMCNNSYALERIGWKGLMVDIHKDVDNLPHRTSPLVVADATKLDWLPVIATAGIAVNGRTTYGSFDIDDATADLIEAFPFESVGFDVLTVETDVYRLGDGPKQRIHKRLLGLGYKLVCEDVKILIPGYIDGSFESWFVSPEREQAASRFKSSGKYWQEILEGCL